MKKIILVVITAFLFVLAGCDKQENNGSTNKYAVALEKVNNVLKNNEGNKKTSLQDVNNSYVEIVDDNSVKAARAMVYYLELLYKNDKFPNTDKPVSFKGDYIKDGKVLQENNMTMLAKTNDKNLISFDACGTSNMPNQEETNNYIKLDIVFNFETDELVSFHLYIASLDSNNELEDIWMSHRYDGVKLYEFRTEDSSIKSELVDYLNDNYWSEYKPQLSTAISAEGNFTYEYTKATDDVFGEGYFN